MPDPPVLPHLLRRPLTQGFVSPCCVPDAGVWARCPPSEERRPRPMDRKGPGL
jgi:hypothetical protein